MNLCQSSTNEYKHITIAQYKFLVHCKSERKCLHYTCHELCICAQYLGYDNNSTCNVSTSFYRATVPLDEPLNIHPTQFDMTSSDSKQWDIVVGHWLYVTCPCPSAYQCGPTRGGRVTPLQWRHNGCDSVWNNKPHDCLLNRLFRRRSKKTSKLRVTGFVRDRWIPRTNGQLRGKCFHLLTSSCQSYKCVHSTKLIDSIKMTHLDTHPIRPSPPTRSGLKYGSKASSESILKLSQIDF